MSQPYQRLTFDQPEIQEDLYPGSVVQNYEYVRWAVPAATELQVQELQALLSEIADLKNDWDGYGAAEMSARAVGCARGMLSSQVQFSTRLPLPDVMPTSSGTVALEWQDERGEAVVEFGETRVSGFVKVFGTTPVYVEGESDKVSEYLPNLIGAMFEASTSISEPLSRIEYIDSSNE